MSEASQPGTVVMPGGPPPYPGVVIGAEAYGVNPFILGVQRRLVDLGYAVAVPDYYHGDGPRNLDAYDDFYAGKGHSFSAPWGPLRHDEAGRAAWDDAVAFLKAHTKG